tara:strand:- start:62 stop:901 length:840 start_codon:yes stop_codon:yes gene_type:complete
MIDVSVIYVSYNTCKLTIESIQSVFKFTKNLNLEIILVDNASKDNSVVKVQQSFPEVKIIQNKKNLGFGRANNKGLQIAKGKYILFLNTDTYLEEPAIEGLFNEMEKDEFQNVAVVGAKLTRPDGSYNISSGLLPSFPHFVKGSFLKRFFKKSYYRNLPPRSIPEYDYPYKVDYVSGADFMVRKNILDRVGGFDSRFFLYSEEVELTHRIYREYPGMVSMIFPQFKIVHISQGSSKNKSDQKRFKLRQIKSRALYYSITRDILSGFCYYFISMKRFYIK